MHQTFSQRFVGLTYEPETSCYRPGMSKIAPEGRTPTEFSFNPATTHIPLVFKGFVQSAGKSDFLKSENK